MVEMVEQVDKKFQNPQKKSRRKIRRDMEGRIEPLKWRKLVPQPQESRFWSYLPTWLCRRFRQEYCAEP